MVMTPWCVLLPRERGVGAALLAELAEQDRARHLVVRLDVRGRRVRGGALVAQPLDGGVELFVVAVVRLGLCVLLACATTWRGALSKTGSLFLLVGATTQRNKCGPAPSSTVGLEA